MAATPANAQRASSSDGLERLAEAMRPSVETGALAGVVPVIVVRATPAFEETRAWFPGAAVSTLVDVFGAGNLRACEACMSPRVHAEDGRLEHDSVDLTVEEIVGFDVALRGQAAPARAAVWLDETPGGVAVRVVSLQTSQILFAGNYDGALREQKRTGRNFTLTEDVERRLRGDSLTHLFIDAALYPGQHFSLDVVDQFGDRNLDLAGVTLSAFDPVLGFGAVYYRMIPEAFNLTLGAQVVASIPTAAAAGLGLEADLLDPLLTGVLVVRWPIPSTSYGLLLAASTNGNVGLGVTLMNFGLLPVLP
jgi:hypothetical protein